MPQEFDQTSCWACCPSCAIVEFYHVLPCFTAPLFQKFRCRIVSTKSIKNRWKSEVNRYMNRIYYNLIYYPKALVDSCCWLTTRCPWKVVAGFFWVVEMEWCCSHGITEGRLEGSMLMTTNFVLTWLVKLFRIKMIKVSEGYCMLVLIHTGMRCFGKRLISERGNQLILERRN